MEAGEGEPLVWLHGGFGLHPTAGTDLLTRSFHLIAFELPGIRLERQTTSTVQSFDELSENSRGRDRRSRSPPVPPARDLLRRRDRAPSRARSSGRRDRLDPRVSGGVPAARLDSSGSGDRSARPAPASRAGASGGDRSGGDAEAERARQPLVADDRSGGAGRSPARAARSDAGDVRGRRHLDARRACAHVLRKRSGVRHPYSFTTPRT